MAANIHPMMPELLGGIELSTRVLKARNGDAPDVLTQMISNAEYWLSFELARFEELLTKAPSPLRELGVAIALRFSEEISGELSLEDLARAREQLFPTLSDDLKGGIAHGLAILERAVTLRDHAFELEEDGFKSYIATQSFSVHALRAGGSSRISVAGYSDDERRLRVQIGDRIDVSSNDLKGRPTRPPEVENRLDTPMLVRDGEESHRTLVFLIPGEYQLRVPGCATGDRKVIAV